ncbi:MAG: aminodeoxychorismate/anthranilate synthase component II [FCB group bacterium]|nr:aminodeoxychorismate/anthranilate synthase component II [FCB group bacterium]
MILIIDNYDSFTYNLYQAVAGLGYRVNVVCNDRISIAEIENDRPEKIIISPGPGRPDETGICIPLIRAVYRAIPILGVCLGHQCLGVAFGAKIGPAKRLIYGRTQPIHRKESVLFAGVENPFPAARYHSLVVTQVPVEFRLTAWSREGDIMAMEHRKYPLFGVQFHPESFMTECGTQMLRNFLACARRDFNYRKMENVAL